MTIGTMDIYLLVIIVSSLVVGFFWGAARSVVLLVAWLAAFLAGAYLRTELGTYLAAQWTNFPATFSQMAAFGLIYMTLLLAAPIVIYASTRGSQNLTRYQVLDDLVSALFAVFVAVLGVAGLIIVLSTFYGNDVGVVSAGGGPEWTANLYQSLLDSSIGGSIDRYLVPIVTTILGPILPADIRDLYA